MMNTQMIYSIAKPQLVQFVCSNKLTKIKPQTTPRAQVLALLRKIELATYRQGGR